MYGYLAKQGDSAFPRKKNSGNNLKRCFLLAGTGLTRKSMDFE